MRADSTPIPVGSSISGGAGVVLAITFFTPWFSACSVNLSGKDLAFGKELGYGLTSDASYPWLVLVLLIGILTAVLALLNLNQSPHIVQKRALISAAAGVIALLLLLVVAVDLISEVNTSQYQFQSELVDFEIKFGYIASLAASGAIVVGALIDMGRIAKPRLGVSSLPHAPDRSFEIKPGHRSPPAHARLPSSPDVTSPILIVKGPSINKEIELYHGDISIGRDDTCDIVIDDPAISRVHARLRHAQGSWFIQDQNSKTGIWLNGRRVSATRIQPGDQIHLGDTKLTIRS